MLFFGPKLKYIYIYFFLFKKMPFLFNSVRFGIGATIRNGRESQCLPYPGFFLVQSTTKLNMKKYGIFQEPQHIKSTTPTILTPIISEFFKLAPLHEESSVVS